MPAHHVITGMDQDGKRWTMESVGDDHLLSAGEYALESSFDDLKSPRVFCFKGDGFVDVTDQAAALVFEKWLEDAEPTDYPPAWLTDNCPAACSEHERRRVNDREAA